MTETTGKKQGQWKKGQSGNPAGRPLGARHKATLAAEILLDGESENITRKAIDMAKAGDSVAMRLCLERIVPPRRDRPLTFSMPPLTTIADLAPAIAAITGAVAAGQITLPEAADLSRMVANFGEAIKTLDLEDRLSKLEKAQEALK